MSTPPCENRAMNDNVMTVAGGGGRRNEPRGETGKNGGKRQFAATFPRPLRRQSPFKPGPFVLIRESPLPLRHFSTKVRVSQSQSDL